MKPCPYSERCKIRKYDSKYCYERPEMIIEYCPSYLRYKREDEQAKPRGLLKRILGIK